MYSKGGDLSLRFEPATFERTEVCSESTGLSGVTVCQMVSMAFQGRWEGAGAECYLGVGWRGTMVRWPIVANVIHVYDLLCSPQE